MENVKQFCKFINENPNSFFVVDTLKKQYLFLGYQELKLEEEWKLEKGKTYFVIKNDVSIVSFKIGNNLPEVPSIKIIASHNDSPSLQNLSIYSITLFPIKQVKFLDSFDRFFLKDNSSLCMLVTGGHSPRMRQPPNRRCT